MKKLMIASYGFKTGESSFESYRLVAVDSTPETSDEDDSKKGGTIFQGWFKRTYPESELFFAQVHPAILEDSAFPRIEERELYTRDHLVRFGYAMMSKQSISNGLAVVTHADVENFRTGEGIV